MKDEHITATERCEPRAGISLEGMDSTQKELLRSRKKSQKFITEADKWREMYLILFPDTDPEDLPSPCTLFPTSNSLQQ
jgi:hypothetical protein